MDFRTMLKKKQYAKWATDEDDPDWGALKHLEEEEQFKLKKVEKVRRKGLKNNYFIKCNSSSSTSIGTQIQFDDSKGIYYLLHITRVPRTHRMKMVKVVWMETAVTRRVHLTAAAFKEVAMYAKETLKKGFPIARNWL